MYIRVHAYGICIILYIYSFSRFCTVMYFTLYSAQDAFMTHGNSIFQLTLFLIPI